MPMTRRALARALAAAALSGAAPCAFAAAPKGMATWSGQARGAAAAIAEAVKKHPFVRGLADGTLPRESFLYYLAQNVHYLEGYAQSLSALGMRLTIDRHRALAKRWAQDTLAERDRVKGVYR
ncbi:MAG: hypothetical protein HUK26_10005, partial [Duodenibacillus sp.]|nr:hypothetical protein [Duodenibacillus sp.]